MTNDQCLFLCPAYKPNSSEQILLFKNNCDRLAERFQLKHAYIEQSFDQPGLGEWHRYLSKDYSVKSLQYKYLWPIRGGYGCINWADELLSSRSKQAPTLIGYSDISVWHNIWHIKDWGESIYAFMPGTLWGEIAESSLEQCLNGEAWCINQEHFTDVNALHHGQTEGPVFASCLRVLSSCIGTAIQPDLDGHILALEDVDERPYSIDRDMQQLHRSGLLEGVRGLVIGTMPCDLPEGYAGPSVSDLFRQWGERLQIPVIQGLPFGHVADPLSLPISRPSVLSASADGWSWSFAERT